MFGCRHMRILHNEIRRNPGPASTSSLQRQPDQGEPVLPRILHGRSGMNTIGGGDRATASRRGFDGGIVSGPATETPRKPRPTDSGGGNILVEKKDTATWSRATSVRGARVGIRLETHNRVHRRGRQRRPPTISSHRRPPHDGFTHCCREGRSKTVQSATGHPVPEATGFDIDCMECHEGPAPSELRRGLRRAH